MYRPEGWKNPYSTLPEHMEREYPVLPEWSAYEAGADAMLEGLRKDGTFGHLFDDSILTPGGSIEGLKGYDEVSSKDGTFIFIPEEDSIKFTLNPESGWRVVKSTFKRG